MINKIWLLHGIIVLALAIPALAQQPLNRPKRHSSRIRIPEGVKALDNIEYYRVNGKPLLLDLYLPKKFNSKLPVIVWVHGGAWMAGSKERCPAVRMAGRGYAVASINYRLSQEAIFPAQIYDCKAAIRWLRANAKTYNLDPDHIGVWGSSAGGHLVALLGTTGDVKELEGEEGNQDYSSRVEAVCDFFGPTDFLKMDAAGSRMKHNSPRSPESQLIGGPIQENKGKVARANPITYVTRDDPPFLIMHGDRDPLVPLNQSELLYEALKKVGVEVTFHVVKGAGHGFGGPMINEMVNAFFDKQLKGISEVKRSVQTEDRSTGGGSPLNFNPLRVVSPRSPITNVPVLAANKVTNQVTGSELVIGVVVNGEARAYPINMLTGPSREIINDTLGNRAIAATW